MKNVYLKKKDAELKKVKILAAVRTNGDWKQLARDEGVKMNTVYRWIRQGQKNDTRGGLRIKKINEEHKQFFVSEIEKNPLTTLSDLVEGLFTKFGLQVSIECVRIHLDNLLYTIKDVIFEPEHANNHANKEKRRDFALALSDLMSKDANVIFMDETNLNLHVARTKGRAIKGTRCTVVSAASKGANIHLIGCIGFRGLIHYEIKRNSHTKETAVAWVKECLRKAHSIYNSSVVLVLDNAPCHNGIEIVTQDPEFKDDKILRLGPYSPMLNPIEHVWSKVKAYVKAEFAKNRNDFLNGHADSESSKSEFRCNKLIGLMKEAIETVTPELTIRCIGRIQGLLSKAILKEDMEF